MGAKETLLTWYIYLFPRRWGGPLPWDLFLIAQISPQTPAMPYHLLGKLGIMVSGTLANIQRKQEGSAEYRQAEERGVCWRVRGGHFLLLLPGEETFIQFLPISSDNKKRHKEDGAPFSFYFVPCWS